MIPLRYRSDGVKVLVGGVKIEESLAAYRTFYVRLHDASWSLIVNPAKQHLEVFISYAREDRDVATRLYNDTGEAGVKPWMDREDFLPDEREKRDRQIILETC